MTVLSGSQNLPPGLIPAKPPVIRAEITRFPRNSPAKLKRLRVSWFLLGGICGLSAGAAGGLLLAHSAPSAVSAAAMPPAPVHAAAVHAAPAPAAAPVKLIKEKEAEAVPPAMPNLPAVMRLRVSRGDTLVDMLTDTGVSYEEASAAVDSLRKVYDPRRLGVGAQVAVRLEPDSENPKEPVLSRLSLPISPTAVVELKRDGKGDFQARKVEEPVERKLVRLGGPIAGSFYETGLKDGIPAAALDELMKVYSYDVDFQRDIKRGDHLTVVMQRMQTKSGAVTGYGDISYAALNLNGRDITIYRYVDRNGNVDYYNEKGESLRKALLRTPINGAHITSGYGMRMHPLLGYSRMHRGIDFGAPIGTPIYAAGDGTIVFAGRRGGYGNYVRIRHDAKYSTAYGHASRIAAGIHPGAHVKQGQVIAYVGSTGMSTGPHLHYEVLVNGEQVNPAGVKFKTGNVLAGRDLAAFKAQVHNIRLALAEPVANKKLAMR